MDRRVSEWQFANCAEVGGAWLVIERLHWQQIPKLVKRSDLCSREDGRGRASGVFAAGNAFKICCSRPCELGVVVRHESH